MKKIIYRIIILSAYFIPLPNHCFALQAGQQMPVKMSITCSTANTLPPLPKNYIDPCQKYPLLCFFHGGGASRMCDGEWNSEFITTVRLSWFVECKQGKFFGINVKEDISSSILIQPEILMAPKTDGAISLKPILFPEEMNNVSNDFKGKTNLNYNGSFFIAGLSLGTEMVSNYIFHRYWKATGTFIQSPAVPKPDYTDSILNVIVNKTHPIKSGWYKTSLFGGSIRWQYLIIRED